MSEIKLLALDLDGTLFTKDKQVTAENRAALKAAEAKGVHVVITMVVLCQLLLISWKIWACWMISTIV